MLINKRICIIFSVKTAFIHILVTALLYILQLHPLPFSFHPLCIRLVPHQWCPTIKGDKVSAALVKSAHRSNTRWSNDAL